MPGGKSQERTRFASSLFFVYMTTRTETHARVGLLLCSSFFQHINNETNKTAGGCFWGAGFSLPLGEPHSFRVSLSGMGLLFRETSPKNAQLYWEMIRDEQEQDNAT